MRSTLSEDSSYALTCVDTKVDVRLPGKKEFKLPWHEAGPNNHHDDKVDSDQYVVNKELYLSTL